MNPTELIDALTPLAWPLVAITALLIARRPLVDSLRRLLRLDMEAKGVKIAATLSGHVTEADAAKVVREGGVGLETRREIVSVMILDLDFGWDGLEHIGPSEAQSLLAEIQSAVADTVRVAEGTIDSWSPDCLVAYWNAPIPRADHAARALRCAIEVQSMLIGRRAKTAPHGVQMRSHALVTTFDTTVGVIGPGASQAFRILESVDRKIYGLRQFARAFGLDVAVTGYAMEHITEDTGLIQLGWARVRGKAEPVMVFAVQIPGGRDVADARRLFEAEAARAGEDAFPFHVLK